MWVLSDLLVRGNKKSQDWLFEKSGFYEITWDDCNQKYIRPIKNLTSKRFNELLVHSKYGWYEQLNLAQHISE